MPALIGRTRTTARPVSARPLALPGQPGFDLWCLTDPYTRAYWQQDPAACMAIAMLWRVDPAPARTLARPGAAPRSGNVPLNIVSLFPARSSTALLSHRPPGSGTVRLTGIPIRTPNSAST